MPFEGMDWTNFWDDSPYALETFVCAPPTDELIAEVEAGISCRKVTFG